MAFLIALSLIWFVGSLVFSRVDTQEKMFMNSFKEENRNGSNFLFLEIYNEDRGVYDSHLIPNLTEEDVISFKRLWDRRATKEDWDRILNYTLDLTEETKLTQMTFINGKIRR